MLTVDEGKTAVRLARRALAHYMEAREPLALEGLPAVFSQKRGAFVTLHEEGELRGCIGYPQPVLPLGRAIVDSAINAGFRDPRFPGLRPGELQRIEIEVTILTKPEAYQGPKRSLPERIQVGRDGLITGLPADAWLDEETQIEHFEAQIFAEVAPEREVFEKSFTASPCGT